MGSRAYTLPNREQHIRENSLSFTLPERDRLARESRYDASFNPNINVDTGTAYPCTRHELALLTDERLLPTVSLPIFTAEKATSSLEDALGPYFTTSPDAVAALQRFQDKGKNPRRWGPDLMFKAFADLDRAFFGGLLRGQVLLQWRSEKYFRTVFGLVTPLAVSDLLEFALEMGRRRIVLNADQLLLHKDVELIHVWTVLLHEMIVSCGRRSVPVQGLPLSMVDY